MQPLEQAHAEAHLQRFHLLPHGGRCHMQLVRGQFEAEVTRGGFKRAERIEGWQGVGHCAAVCHR